MSGTKINTKETVTIGNYTLPNTDGTLDQVLKTDGSGIISWDTIQRTASVIQSLSPTGTTQTIDWSLGDVVSLDVSGASGNITLTLNNPSFGDYSIKVIQGATARDIIFPAGTKQGNGVTGATAYGLPSTTQMISILYKGSYFITVNETA
jgi:hypothetical protein